MPGATRNWPSSALPACSSSSARRTIRRRGSRSPARISRRRSASSRPINSTSIGWSRITATACSTTRSPTCRSIRSSWKSFFCNTCSAVGGRFASCRCWSARSRIASSPAPTRRRCRTLPEWSRRCGGPRPSARNRCATLSVETWPTSGRNSATAGRSRPAFLTKSRTQDRGDPGAGRGRRPGRLLPVDRGRRRCPPHLRPAADLDGLAGDPPEVAGGCCTTTSTSIPRGAESVSFASAAFYA